MALEKTQGISSIWQCVKSKTDSERNVMETFYACIDETFKVVKATVTKFHVTALRSRMAKADEILDAVPDPEMNEKVFVYHLRSKDSTTKVLSEMKKAIDVAISEVTGTKDWGIEFDEDSGFQNYMSEVDNALAKGEALESVVFLNALVLLLRTAIIAMPQGKDIRANLLSVVGTFVQRQELLIPEALLERAKLLLLAYEDSKQACLALLEATNTKGETVVKKRAWAAGAIKEMRKKIRTDDEAIIPFDRDRLSASFTAQALPTPQPVSTDVKPKGKPTARRPRRSRRRSRGQRRRGSRRRRRPRRICSSRRPRKSQSRQEEVVATVEAKEEVVAKEVVAMAVAVAVRMQEEME